MRKICIFTMPFPFMHSVNQGIAACSRKIGPWRIDVQFFVDEKNAASFVREEEYDGVIMSYARDFVNDIEASGIPVVMVESNVGDIPSVSHDHEAIGAAGAKHLVECGYRRFAFYGPRDAWSQDRFRGFSNELNRLSMPAPRLIDDNEARLHGQHRRISAIVDRFIADMNPPVAVMACNDHLARIFLDYAIEQKVRVPGDLAVIGVDNDELSCETGACPMSSVDTDLYRLGFEAGILLDRRMRGEPIPKPLPKVAPKGIELRQSTSLFAHDDPDVASALRFIYERASRGITVSEVCRHVCISRRRLEQRFLQALGRSPGDEIRLLRIERAKTLLLETTMTLDEIGSRCGYSFTSGFSKAFRDLVGKSPGEFRRQRQV
jgi:LacI family transcriptional regulator